MKLFRDDAEIDQIDRVIETMKEAERILTSAIVRGEDYARPVPVTSRCTDMINTQMRRIVSMRMDMQEEGLQYRKSHRLPPPPDGYC